MDMGKKPKKIYRPFDDEDDDDAPGFPFFGGDVDGEGDGPSPEDILPGFNDIFKNLMKQFKSKDFMNFSKNLFKQMGLPDPTNEPVDPGTQRKGRVDIKGPFVYGFSVKFDENGKPIIDKFGNIKAPVFTPPVDQEEADDPTRDTASMALVREPIADIIEEDDEILVVVELPGVQKEDITLDATEASLEISAVAPPVADTTTPRKYQKRLALPGKINPDVAKARYTNGILEVRLKKVGQKPPRSANIPIE